MKNAKKRDFALTRPPLHALNMQTGAPLDVEVLQPYSAEVHVHEDSARHSELSLSVRILTEEDIGSCLRYAPMTVMKVSTAPRSQNVLAVK